MSTQAFGRGISVMTLCCLVFAACTGAMSGKPDEDPQREPPGDGDGAIAGSGPTAAAPPGEAGAAGTAPPSAGGGAGMAEPPGGGPVDYATRGILDCPTVAPPAYTRAVPVSLSEPFARSCGGCHGERGQGRALYPAIPGTLSFAEYSAVVRKGRKAMPAFPESDVSDADLAADYEALRRLSAEANGSVRATGDEWTWSEADVEAAHRRGMAAWRAPDKDGIACANCHSPDALDLAVIGYPDDAVLRRAGKHIPLGLAADVVDLIHAQRRRFGIKRPCARSWRPLQPGGEVLPGNTAEEQDASFARELVTRKVLIATTPVETAADARRVFDDLVKLNLRKLRIGIAFPRWTEDAFNGEDHRTMNDYLMGVGRIPSKPAEWYALEDRYLGNPTEENLFPLIERLPRESHDNGFSARTLDANAPAQGRCNYIHREGGGFLTFVDLAKKQSLYLVQHFMRMAVLGKPSWYDLPSTPLPSYAKAYGKGLDPFTRMGAQLAEHNCRNAGAMLATWPSGPADEVPAADRANGEAVELSRQLNHPWQTLGAIYDQAMLMNESFGQDQNLHYWAINGFVQNRVHLPFLYLHRIFQQARHWDELRSTDAYPKVAQSLFNNRPVHPLLDGERLFFKDAVTTVLEGDDERATVSHAVRCNGMRAILLMQQQLLRDGAPALHVQTQQNNTGTLFENYDTWRVFAERLGRMASKVPLPAAWKGREALCTTGLQALIEETRKLAAASKDLAVP